MTSLPRHARPPRGSGLLVSALLGLAGCGRQIPHPSVVSLASGFHPRSLAELSTTWEADLPAAQRLRPVQELFGLGLRRMIAPEEWQPCQAPDTWSLVLSRGALRFRIGEPRLAGKDLALTRVADTGGVGLAPHQYLVDEERITLRLAPGEKPPGLQLAARLENGRAVEAGWQVRVGRYCGLAIPVYCGEKEELVRDVPPASRLAFRFVPGVRVPAEVRYRVELDGALLVEGVVAPAESEPARFVSAPLPPAGAKGARIVFAVEGAAGMGVFLTPEIAPLDVGKPAARPWPGQRPDIVLFLPDTFRADNLAFYGGDPALAPNLDQFAEQCLRFTHARANADWTLPSISTLLTGLYPGQHGATDEKLSLPAHIDTLPERLARAGYRTGAITDGSFFSPEFGLDQGFEFFTAHAEKDWDIDRTFAEAREFLAQDDGRPAFLVVHTYRVHQPYREGDREDRTAYDRILAQMGDEALSELGTKTPPPEAGKKIQLRHAAELLPLYRAGVRDLDRAFGAFLADLEREDFFARAYLAVASDHGEALGENHDMFHSGHLWEVKLRVPLFLRGPELVPRAVDSTATLLDLAPTFAQLARVAPDPRWLGASLIRLDRERPALAFQLGAKSHEVALLERAHKVITTPEGAALERGACEEAYDLGADPGEEQNLARDAPWPAEMTRRLSRIVLSMLVALGPEERATPDEELRRQLDGMGYGGEEGERQPPRMEGSKAAPPR